jgi:uroporphyrinogen decarboxylase
MTPRERIWAALDKEEPDKVPMFEFEVQISEQIIGPNPLSREEAERMKKKGKEMRVRELDLEYRLKLWKKLGYDMIAVPTDLLSTAKRMAPDLAYLGGCGGVSPMPGSMGDIETIRRFYYDQGTIKKQCSEMTKNAIERAKEQVDAGLYIIRGGLDDMAGKEGPYLAPRFYEKFIFPNLGKLARAVNNMGAKLLVHSDGDLNPILDGLVGSGIDALHSIDPSSNMDIHNVKEKYGDKVCIFGNVDCAWTLTRGTVQQVIDETKLAIENAAPGGGYVLSSSNVIHAAVPLENAMAMIEVGHRHGFYGGS